MLGKVEGTYDQKIIMTNHVLFESRDSALSVLASAPSIVPNM